MPNPVPIADLIAHRKALEAGPEGRSRWMGLRQNVEDRGIWKTSCGRDARTTMAAQKTGAERRVDGAIRLCPKLRRDFDICVHLRFLRLMDCDGIRVHLCDLWAVASLRCSDPASSIQHRPTVLISRLGGLHDG